MLPVARLSDFHVCPMVSGLVPHVGGPILPICAIRVLSGGLPTARIGDLALCVGPPDMIVTGVPKVLVMGKPVARITDKTMHGGMIVVGLPNVLIGGGTTAQVRAPTVGNALFQQLKEWTISKLTKEFDPPQKTKSEKRAITKSARSGADHGIALGAPNGATAGPPPTPAERALAAAPGDTPSQRSAREKVVKHFFESRGMGGELGGARKGIDMRHPVEVVDFPPPDSMQQYVRRQQRGAPPGTPGEPGNWFSPVLGQTGDQLGLNDDPAHRTPRNFDTRSAGQALSSTAAPIIDDWTDPAKPHPTAGGGRQYTVDNSTRDQISAANRRAAP